MVDSLKQAKSWWAKNVNERPVWRTEDIPDPHFKTLLLSLKMAYEVRRDIIVLGKPDTEISVLIHSYFWEIVSCVLKSYAPFVITGMSAIHLLLGDESIPSQVDILTENSSARIDLRISLLAIEKKPGFFQPANAKHLIKTIETNKKFILSLESPESLLLRLRPQYFRDYPQLISGFLKATDFNLDILSELILQQSKPVTYLRLAELFKQIGKEREAEMFKTFTKISSQYAPPGKSQILKYALPRSLVFPNRISDAAYVIRFRDQLRAFAEYIEKKCKNLILPSWNLSQIKTYIEETKKYDTYHSSTIEGYRVTQEEIQKLIEGREIITLENNAEEIERKMALKGYLVAHKYVRQQIEENFKKNRPLTESNTKEIYAHLFTPSVEAGILEKEQLTQYRNDAVFIRNSRTVPPNHLKVSELMRCLVEEVNEIKSKVTQALIAHYGFVTIHPYFDGNGRVARFLMNYLLCCNGIPWVTIRIEDRDEYFSALETAQCDENIEPFANFLKKYLIALQLS